MVVKPIPVLLLTLMASVAFISLAQAQGGEVAVVVNPANPIRGSASSSCARSWPARNVHGRAVSPSG